MYNPGFLNKPSALFRLILANAALSIFIIFAITTGVLDERHSFPALFCWVFSISFTQWIGLQFIHGYLDRRISWIETPVRKTFIEILAFLGYSTSAFILMQFLNYYLWLGIQPIKSWGGIIRSLPYTLLISLIISLIFTSVGFFRAWKKSLVQSEKLKVEMMAYKYESLRNQINPHFLFNSLNVLSDLVYDDQDLAVKFIRQMSDLFRYVLDSRDKELVPLNDELEFISSFTFLLKTRFEDKLIIENEVKADSADYIVPMTLQLLIENAVKHNEVSEAFPLRISLRRSVDYLEVENIIHPKSVSEKSMKTGLKNIIQQFNFFSDQPIEIIHSEESFLVRIPILRMTEK